MIIIRSPLRVSFAGGGTDLPAFYERYGPGIVVSTAIDRHVYVTLNEKFGGGVSVRYRVHENVENVRDLRHALIREVLLQYGIESGVELVVASDVPARGSGLGASSALACALVMACELYFGRGLVRPRAGVDRLMAEAGEEDFRRRVAETAAALEIERAGSPIGKQDHYASAFGGLRLFRFERDGTVTSELFEAEDFIVEIESQSMLFYLEMEHEYRPDDKRRNGSFVQRILHDQVSQMAERRKVHELQRDNAAGLWQHMAYEVPERFIDHVNENWRLKRQVHPDITNGRIDEIVQRAFAAGATAAKVCGAGGGGFLYLVVPRSMQDGLRSALGLRELAFSFSRTGTEVVFDDGRTLAPTSKK